MLIPGEELRDRGRGLSIRADEVEEAGDEERGESSRSGA